MIVLISRLINHQWSVGQSWLGPSPVKHLNINNILNQIVFFIIMGIDTSWATAYNGGGHGGNHGDFA